MWLKESDEASFMFLLFFIFYFEFAKIYLCSQHANTLDPG